MNLKPVLSLSCFFAWLSFSLAQNTVDVVTLSDSVQNLLQYTILNEVEYKDYKDSVTILVRVTDPDGNFVLGMAKPGKKQKYKYFNSLVDKAENEICKNFTVMEASADKNPVPFYLSVVLDYSGSMDKHCDSMQYAAQQFISGLSNVYFTRVNFDEDIDLVEPVPTLRPKSVRKDIYAQYGGQTALYAAVDAGVQSIKDAQGARFVIVFTDGFEKASAGQGYASNELELIQSARAAKAPIYAVGFEMGGYPALDAVCTYTRGQYYEANDIKKVLGAFERMRSTTYEHYYIIRAICPGTPAGISTPKGIVLISPAPVPPPGPNTPPPFNYVWTAKFSVSDAKLSDNDKKTLEKIADRIVLLLKKNPTLQIKVQGHASPDGEQATNEMLASDRAEVVYSEIRAIIKRKYLKDAEAIRNLNRISQESFGHDKPIFPVTSSKNPENRRVEIIGI